MQQVSTSNKVLDALEYVLKYQATSKEAQQFSNKYMKPIVDAILDQQVARCEKKTNQIIAAILRTAVDIVRKDLTSSSSDAGNCNILDTLASIFNKKKKYYGDTESSGNNNPGVRVDMIKRFSWSGFHHLATRLARVTSEFPNLDTLHLLLLASIDATFVVSLDEPAQRISRAAKDHLMGLDDLTKYSTQDLFLVRHDLQRLCKNLALSKPRIMSDFNQFWRGLTLKLIKSESQEHKLFGLKEIEYLIDACRLPEAYIVKGAGAKFVNGRYEISSSVITNGCVSAQTITYERTSDCGKKLRLQPCLMTEPGKSHCEVWFFLSSTKGVDYYFHETNLIEQDKPPLLGWDCCTGGQHPPPTLEQSSNTIPLKDEKGNLEKQLINWAVDNDVYGILLGRCIDESHLRASASLRNFLSKMNTPNLTGEQLVLSNSLCRGASVLESILPLITSTGPTIRPQSQPIEQISSPSASSYFAAIEAAKQRLLSAQRWKESMESALKGYLDASREVQAARLFLLELEKSHGIIDVDADDEDNDAPQAKRSKPNT
jgi:hypothetical protein